MLVFNKTFGESENHGRLPPIASPPKMPQMERVHEKVQRSKTKQSRENEDSQVHEDTAAFPVPVPEASRSRSASIQADRIVNNENFSDSPDNDEVDDADTQSNFVSVSMATGVDGAEVGDDGLGPLMSFVAARHTGITPASLRAVLLSLKYASTVGFETMRKGNPQNPFRSAIASDCSCAPWMQCFSDRILPALRQCGVELSRCQTFRDLCEGCNNLPDELLSITNVESFSAKDNLLRTIESAIDAVSTLHEDILRANADGVTHVFCMKSTVNDFLSAKASLAVFCTILIIAGFAFSIANSMWISLAFFSLSMIAVGVSVFLYFRQWQYCIQAKCSFLVACCLWFIALSTATSGFFGERRIIFCAPMCVLTVFFGLDLRGQRWSSRKAAWTSVFCLEHAWLSSICPWWIVELPVLASLLVVLAVVLSVAIIDGGVLEWIFFSCCFLFSIAAHADFSKQLQTFSSLTHSLSLFESYVFSSLPGEGSELEPENRSDSDDEDGRRRGVIETSSARGLINIPTSTNNVVLTGRNICPGGEFLLHAHGEKISGRLHGSQIVRSMLDDVHNYVAIVIIDSDGNIASWNRRMQSITEFPQTAVLGSAFVSLLQAENNQLARVQEVIHNTMNDRNTGKALRKISVNTCHSLRRPFIEMDFSPYPAKNTEGETVGVALIGNPCESFTMQRVADEIFDIQTSLYGKGEVRHESVNDEISGRLMDLFVQMRDAIELQQKISSVPSASAEKRRSIARAVREGKKSAALIYTQDEPIREASDRTDYKNLVNYTSDQSTEEISLVGTVGRIVAQLATSRCINLSIAPTIPARVAMAEDLLCVVLMEALQNFSADGRRVQLEITDGGLDDDQRRFSWAVTSIMMKFSSEDNNLSELWQPSDYAGECLKSLRSMMRFSTDGSVKLLFLGARCDTAIRPNSISTLAEPTVRCNCALFDTDPISNALIRNYLWQHQHLLFFIENPTKLMKSLDGVDILFLRAPRNVSPDSIEPMLHDIVQTRTHLFVILIAPIRQDRPENYYGDHVVVLSQPINTPSLASGIMKAKCFTVLKREREVKLQEMKRLFSTTKNCPWIRGKMLGRGSFATVYEATNELTKGKMAVRCIAIEGSDDPAELNRKVNDTIDEIKLMSSLEHRNIISYLYCEKGEGSINIFMEFAAKGSIRGLLDRQGPASISTAAGWMKDILCGLQYLHSEGVIHLDIKCANVLLTEDGTCKLADFGTAKRISHSSTSDSEFSAAGTLHFTAPEVLGNTQPTVFSDVWSVGCLLVEILTAKLPFNHIQSPIAVVGYLSSLRPGDSPIVPTSITDPYAMQFILSCLQVDPLARPNVETLLCHPFIYNNIHNASAKETLFSNDDGDAESNWSEDERRESCFTNWAVGRQV